MAISFENVRTQRLLDLHNLRDVDREWLIDEIQEEVTAQLLSEHKAQSRHPINQTATGIRLDARHITLTPQESNRLAAQPERSIIRGFDRRVALMYQGGAELYFPLVFAWTSIQAAWVRLTGKAHQSMYVWAQDNADRSRDRKFTGLAGIKEWLRAATTRDVSLAILGPTTAYRRKLIYRGQPTKYVKLSEAFRRRGRREMDRWRFVNPNRETRVGRDNATREQLYARRGRPSVAFRSTIRGSQIDIRAQVSRAIHEVVKYKVKSKFRDVWAGYFFIRSREPLEPNAGQNIPVLYLAPMGRRTTGAV